MKIKLMKVFDALAMGFCLSLAINLVIIFFGALAKGGEVIVSVNMGISENLVPAGKPWTSRQRLPALRAIPGLAKSLSLDVSSPPYSMPSNKWKWAPQ